MLGLGRSCGHEHDAQNKLSEAGDDGEDVGGVWMIEFKAVKV